LAAAPGFAAASGVPAPSGKVRVLLDTDTYNEIDDQFALAYGLLSPGQMSIEAIYAAPFVNNRARTPAEGMERSYDEILRVLDKLGLREGHVPLKGSREWMRAKDAPVESPAAADMVERVMRNGGDQLYIVALGAPTNVASALLLEPRLVERVTVVWLGGRPYNFPTAEAFNLRQDMHATRLLFDSGVKLLNTPGPGVCENLRTTEDELERFLKGRSEIADYLFELFRDYRKRAQADASFPYSKPIWDVVPMAWLVNPAWVESVVTPSPVLTDERTWLHDPYRHLVRVATRILRDRIFDDLFRKLANAAA
jgi:inosine-uridine nucleoside N-ribohydrolase